MIRGSEFPNRKDLAHIPASKLYPKKLRLRAQGRAECPRCGSSGVHVSPNMSGRVCGLCLGQRFIDALPEQKARPSRGFGKSSKTKGEL